MHTISSALLLLCALLPMARALPVSNADDDLISRDPRPTIEQQTDGLLFHTPMNAFLAAKAARNPATLDWNDNGCSIVPDDPIGFDFLHSCQRHDFGYRNYKIQGRCSEDERGKIDENFKKDMLNECDEEYGGILESLDRIACRGAANVYFRGVRAVGEKFFC